MEHRGTKLFAGYVFGPEVEATNPEELVEKTDQAHADAVREKPKN